MVEQQRVAEQQRIAEQRRLQEQQRTEQQRQIAERRTQQTTRHHAHRPQQERPGPEKTPSARLREQLEMATE